MPMCCRYTDGDEIDYHAFLAGIDWLEHPAPPVLTTDTLKVRKRNFSHAFQIRNSIEKAEKTVFRLEEIRKSTVSDLAMCAPTLN